MDGLHLYDKVPLERVGSDRPVRGCRPYYVWLSCFQPKIGFSVNAWPARLLAIIGFGAIAGRIVTRCAHDGRCEIDLGHVAEAGGCAGRIVGAADIPFLPALLDGRGLLGRQPGVEIQPGLAPGHDIPFCISGVADIGTISGRTCFQRAIVETKVMKQKDSSFSNVDAAGPGEFAEFMVKVKGSQSISIDSVQRRDAVLRLVRRAARPDRDARIGAHQVAGLEGQDAMPEMRGGELALAQRRILAPSPSDPRALSRRSSPSPRAPASAVPSPWRSRSTAARSDRRSAASSHPSTPGPTWR